MRFIEIANPEDQLALWRLVSDKMWAALGQPVIQQTKPLPTQQLVKSPTKAVAKPTSRTQAKSQGKRKTSPVKAHKPKKAPMAPAPKPLPKVHLNNLEIDQSQHWRSAWKPLNMLGLILYAWLFALTWS